MSATLRRPNRWYVLATFLVLFAAAACGSDDEASQPNNTGGTGVLEDRVIARTDSVFSMDDLVAQGYKKSKAFDTETLGGASEAWYGFFDQQDIEVRFYSSHADALELGVESAEEVIGITAGQRDYLIPVVNLYPAYAVVGNTVMLCERQISTCEALIAALPE